MRTDPDGLPHHDDRRVLAEALRAALTQRFPEADADLAAAIGAMAASRFFGVRFRAEGNAACAWVARRPNPDVFEVWDPATGAWNFVERLPDPSLYQPTPEGTARIAARAQEAMATAAAAGRLAHALAMGVEPDDEW